MPYRDERDALRIRVKDLEGELATSREVIARLQGERAASETREQKASWFTGAPTRLDLARDLPFEVSDAGYEAIADLVRVRLPPEGQLSQVGRTLTFRRLGQELRVSRTGEGSTQVTLAVDQRNAGTLFALALPGAVILAMAPVAAGLKSMGYTPLSLIVALPFLLAVVYGVLRPLVARLVRKDRDKLAGVFESVVQLAAQHPQPARRRVESAPTEPSQSTDAPSEPAEDLSAALGAEPRSAGR